jgi:hypothetical protein
MTALTDTEVRWPPGLGRPDADAAVVYLDLLHWIGLAKAATGHRGGARYADVLAACRSARDAGVAIFPLSAVHYMEVSKIVRPDRRADIATIMEELSGFRTLVGRAQLLRIEREAALDEVTLPRAYAPAGTSYVGVGFGHAFGRSGRLKLSGPAEHVRRFREQVGDDKVNELLALGQLMTERMVLRGPQSEAETMRVREHRWEPKATVTVAEERATDEQKLVELLNEKDPHRRRVRDFVRAYELTTEIDALARNLQTRPAVTGALLTGRNQLEAMIDLMPSLLVTVELKTAYHRNPHIRWTSHAMFDIDAMSVAVPYCDVVASDTETRAMINRTRLGDAMGTEIVSRPEEVAELLRDLTDRMSGERAGVSLGPAPRRHGRSIERTATMPPTAPTLPAWSCRADRRVDGRSGCESL